MKLFKIRYEYSEVTEFSGENGELFTAKYFAVKLHKLTTWKKFQIYEG